MQIPSGISKLIKTGLDKAADTLEHAIKPEALDKVLKGADVTKAEQRAANIKPVVNEQGKITPEALKQAVAEREDEWGAETLTGTNATYASITTSPNNPTYKERIYTLTKGPGKYHEITVKESKTVQAAIDILDSAGDVALKQRRAATTLLKVLPDVDTQKLLALDVLNTEYPQMRSVVLNKLVAMPKRVRAAALQLAELSKTGDIAAATELRDHTLPWVTDELLQPTRTTDLLLAAGRKQGYEMTPPHFAGAEIDNYTSHIRFHDNLVAGAPTRVIEEVQNDLLNLGRDSDNIVSRYDKAFLRRYLPTIESFERRMSTATGAEAKALQASWERFRTNADISEATPTDSLAIISKEESARTDEHRMVVPMHPLKDKWLRKTLEKGIADAIDEGRGQIAMPISGYGVAPLKRGKGVQQWYETTVLDTLRKLAKENDMDFFMHDEYYAVSAVDKQQAKDKLADVVEGVAAIKQQFPDVSENDLRMDVLEYAVTALPDILARVGIDMDSLLYSRTDDAYLLATGKLTLDDLLASVPTNAPAVSYAVLKLKYQKSLLEDAADAGVLDTAKLGATGRTADVEAKITPIMEQLAKAQTGSTTETELREQLSKFTGMKQSAIPQAAHIRGDEEQVRFHTRKLLMAAVGRQKDSTAKEVQAMRGAHNLTEEQAIEAYAQQLIPVGFRKPKSKTNFTLYSNGSVGAFVAYQMLSAGDDEETVRADLAEQGLEPNDIDKALQDAVIISEAKAQGHSDEDIKELLDAEDFHAEVAPGQAKHDESDTQQWIKTADEFTNFVDNAKTPEELLASLELIYPVMTRMHTDVQALAGQPEAVAKVDAARRASAQKIVQAAYDKYGVTFEWVAEDTDGQPSGYYVVNEDGSKAPAQSFWGSLKEGVKASRQELAYGITAGIAAAYATPGPLPAKAAASFTFGTLGAAAGAERDYIREAMIMQEEIDDEVLRHKAFTVAEWSVVGEALGYGVIKTAKYTVKGMKQLWKPVAKAKDLLINGNAEGARKALDSMMFMTPESKDDLIQQLKRLTVAQSTDPTSKITELVKDFVTNKRTERIDEEIVATLLSKPGGEAFIHAVSAIDPLASRIIANGIDKRAQDLLKTTAELTDANAGKILREDLGNYTTDVKQYYQKVKELANKSPKAHLFQFKYDALAIDPVLDTIGKNIEDKDLQHKFLTQASKWRDQSQGRSFGDLLELYKLVNEYTFSKRINHGKNKESLFAVLGNIKGAIKQGAYVTQERPAEWLDMWNTSNKMYSEMKQLERNVLYRALTRPGLKDATVTQALDKYINAVDGTYMEVVSKLPRAARDRAEGAVIDTLANKFTAGSEGGLRATHFPMLAKELEGVTFTSPEARKMKRAIGVFAEYFKNDVNIARASGDIVIPKEQSYLTTDPVSRLHFEIASSVFNKIRRMQPTDKGNVLALATRAVKALENPKDSKAIKELMQEVEGEVVIAKQLEQLAIEVTKQAADNANKVSPIYHFYGSGKYLSLKGSGEPIKIAKHRIATHEDVAKLAESIGVHREDTMTLDHALKDRGFAAVQVGSNKIRRIE